MSRWYPAVDSHWSASKAAKMGVFGALGFAAWIGVPATIAIAAGHVRMGFISPIEVAVVMVLASVALFAAWRFRHHQGLIVGPVILVALILEVAKRIALMFGGTLSFGVFDAVVTIMMFFGLLNGIRGVRALRHLSPDDDLEEIFQ